MRSCRQPYGLNRMLERLVTPSSNGAYNVVPVPPQVPAGRSPGKLV